MLKVVGGEIFPESKEEDDDPLQMGGDFTLSRSGSIGDMTTHTDQ